MNKVPYILKFTYDVILGLSYELVPMQETIVNIRQAFNSQTQANIKVMQRQNNGKNR